MTGPEHYLAAERCLSEANDVDHTDAAARDGALARAQVHAALALAAATALGAESRGQIGEQGYPALAPADLEEWKQVAAVSAR
ncbi:hypothetical protein [Actinokineospora diospyrosa]|uniref:Uncharacterized protein n=1 Tax=Actinokineospora diospyrosa TaxID=103728 RepID=A0ABT1IJ90_9PSEU|nr:hypothetical protein [Actinokineospora diospyrosa]MCP2272717.1 hypothetical protein [Actinokineospora diospyrosa]